MKESDSIKENMERSTLGGVALIALVAAIGVTAAALVVTRKLRAANVRGTVDNLFSACDRAAQALDERLHPDLSIA